MKIKILFLLCFLNQAASFAGTDDSPSASPNYPDSAPAETFINKIFKLPISGVSVRIDSLSVTPSESSETTCNVNVGSFLDRVDGSIIYDQGNGKQVRISGTYQGSTFLNATLSEDGKEVHCIGECSDHDCCQVNFKVSVTAEGTKNFRRSSTMIGRSLYTPFGGSYVINSVESPSKSDCYLDINGITSRVASGGPGLKRMKVIDIHMSNGVAIVVCDGEGSSCLVRTDEK